MERRPDNILRLIYSIRFRIAVLLIARSIFIGVIFFMFMLMMLAVIDFMTGIGSYVRHVFLLLVFISSILLLIYKMIYALLNVPDKTEAACLIQDRASFFNDEIVNAYYLGRKRPEGVSGELIDLFMHDSEKNAARVKASVLISYLPTRYHVFLMVLVAGVLLSLYSLPPYIFKNNMIRVLFPLTSGTSSGMIKVYPGDKKVMFGSDMNVSVEVEGMSDPYITYRKTGKSWKKNKMRIVKEGRFIYDLKQIKEDMEYFILWKDVRSSVYSIDVIIPPAVGNIKTEYIFPGYTGMKKKYGDGGRITAIPGTRVVINAESNKELAGAALYTDTDIKVECNISDSRKSFFAEVIVIEPGAYWFKVEDMNGIVNSDPIKYPIVVLEDMFPIVKLIEPTEDMLIAESGNLEIVYSAEDDYGISEIRLVLEYPGQEGRVYMDIKKPSESRYEYSKYHLNISDLDLRAAESVEYFIEASDNDTVSGPKRGRSEKRIIEIFSYEKEHEIVRSWQRDVQEGLLDLLEKQVASREALLSEDREKSLAEEISVLNDAGNLLKSMDEFLPRMERDPYLNRSANKEYYSMRDNLEYIKENKMTKAIESIRKGDLEVAGNIEDDIISSLEKLAAISEDAVKRAAMSNLINEARDLLELNKDFLEMMEQREDFERSELLKRLYEHLARINEKLEEIKRAMKELSSDLPEEFYNQESIKNLDMSSLANDVKRLSEALDTGNIEEALARAEKMLGQISSLNDLIQKSAAGVIAPLSEDARMINEKLDEILKGEKAVYSNTKVIYEKHREELNNYQSELLEKIILKQNELMGMIEERLSDKNYSIYRYRMKKISDLMNKVKTELKDKKVIFSNEYIKDIKKELNSILETEKKKSAFVKGKKADNYGRSLIEDIAGINERQEEILSMLADEDPGYKNVFTEEAGMSIKEIEKEQESLYIETGNVMKMLDGLSLKTALVKIECMDNVSLAANEMKMAVSSLGDKNIKKAIGEEEEAILYLQKAMKSMSDAIKALADMELNMGKPLPLYANFPGSGSGSGAGFREGAVDIPSEKDFKPSREFREEILKALKEPYPKIYEELIKEYYKRLVK